MENCIVKHVIWGRGRIESKDGRYIKVLFDNPEIGEKTFVYPSAFAKYITYEDKDCQAKVEEEIREISREAEEKAVNAERARIAAAIAAQEKEKNLLSKKKKAIAYSRKRAERLRMKPAQDDDLDSEVIRGSDAYIADDDILSEKKTNKSS